jgi:hypothetical protein
MSVFVERILLVLLLFLLSSCSIVNEHTSFLDHKNIEVSNHLQNYISVVPISITNHNTEITLHDSASAEKILLDLQIINYKENIPYKIKISSLSHCPVEIKNDRQELTIDNMRLVNVYLSSQPNFRVKNLDMIVYEATYTSLPIVTGTAKIIVEASEDMKSVQKLLRGINIVPASGEYVYDTKIIYKNGKPINSNTDSNISDASYNLNTIGEYCPNLEWASPVIAWFGTNTTNMEVKDLMILPGVDNKDGNFSERWQVSKYNRDNAYLISKNEYGNTNYGGTVNDQSLLRYVDALRKKKLKIMFYPMIYMDIPGKPWRGNIKGTNAKDVANFFNKTSGYNEFILHYANLLKDRVDAFAIGSELQDLTQSTDLEFQYPNPKRYPAVIELKKLAQKVKAILGPKVIITYAANWSEYHHDINKIHHLDDLWASPNIDVVGIDAYLPITNKTMGDISIQEIKDGWESGELWHYYYDHNKKQNIPAELGIKQVEYWWKNYHWSQGIKSEWKPRMKPIWFTEFGFPSMHMATNTPHIYWNPKSTTENIPKKSSGKPDFAIQSRAIRATIEYWNSKKDIVQNMFLWAWDARPFPYFPNRTDIWSDGEMWSRGHLVNGKIYPLKQIRLRAGTTVENLIVEADTLVLEGHNNIKNISTNNIKYLN